MGGCTRETDLSTFGWIDPQHEEVDHNIETASCRWMDGCKLCVCSPMDGWMQVMCWMDGWMDASYVLVVRAPYTGFMVDRWIDGCKFM